MKRRQTFPVGHFMNPAVTKVPAGLVQAPRADNQRHPQWVAIKTKEAA